MARRPKRLCIHTCPPCCFGSSSIGPWAKVARNNVSLIACLGLLQLRFPYPKKCVVALSFRQPTSYTFSNGVVATPAVHAVVPLALSNQLFSCHEACTLGFNKSFRRVVFSRTSFLFSMVFLCPL